ncbi:hypothetical protein [Nonomuraea insulae]|uniref:Uncharacterized protein n=1 Tax=Nonomuraea insulae TaxID=1616787 RepID=A0ABW1CQ65_9ACTN
MRDRVKSAGLLDDNFVSALEVLDAEELEMIEGLAENDGPSLKEVLEQKAKSGMQRAGVRTSS